MDSRAPLTSIYSYFSPPSSLRRMSSETICTDTETNPPGLTIMGLAEAWKMGSCAAESVVSAAARKRVTEEANFIVVKRVEWSVCVVCGCGVGKGKMREDECVKERGRRAACSACELAGGG